jgi:hypothetical protein
LLGEPDGDEEDDAADDQQGVQSEHRAHDAALLPCPRGYKLDENVSDRAVKRGRLAAAKGYVV